MSADDKIQKVSPSLPAFMTESLKNPLDYLSPKAQKIAHQKVMTSLTDDQIMKRHGLTKREYNKIVNNQYFQGYMKQCQSQLFDGEFFEKAKAQEMYLRNQIFEEMASRFEKPDPDRDLGPDRTLEQESEYYKRFAYYANFKDMMRVWEGVDKRTRLNVGEATENVGSADQLVQGVQERFSKLTARRRRMQEMMGVDDVPVSVEVQNSDGTYSAVETHTEKNTNDGFEEELILEEYSITRKR
jgi:hypothetical protein